MWLSTSIPLFYDNKLVIYIKSNLIFHKYTKHIKIDCHFILENLLVHIINPRHIYITFQLADIFTKAMGYDQFHILLSKLGLWNLQAPIWKGVLAYHIFSFLNSNFLNQIIVSSNWYLVS